MLFEVGDGGDEHAGAAASGVVDGLSGPGLEDLGHQVDDRAVGVELLGGVSRIVRELLDEVLVALAELVLGTVGYRKHLGAEVLDEVLEQTVGQALLVGPGGVAEDAAKLGIVGCLDGTEGVDDGLADILCDLPDIAPVGAIGDGEAMVLWQGCELRISVGGFQRFDGLLVVDVGEALEEQQREDVLLVRPGIDVGAQ